MTFEQSIRNVLANYANFEGRASRPEFWWFFLFYLLVQLAASVVDLALFSSSVGVLSTLSALALLLPYLAVSARRLHDIDRSAWWLLLSFVPLVGPLVLIVFFVLPPTDGPNRFGPDTRDTSVISA